MRAAGTVPDRTRHAKPIEQLFASRPHMFRHGARNVKHDLVVQHLNASTRCERFDAGLAGHRHLVDVITERRRRSSK